MLAEALEALAAAGGGALVQSMTTDAWMTVRPRLVRLLGGGQRAVELVEVSERRLASAGEPAAEATTVELTQWWHDELRRVLQQRPDAANELRALLADAAPPIVQQQTNTAYGNGTVNAVQGGSLIKYLNG